MAAKRVLALVVLAVLASARPANADWLDIIWEMTGPQMIGIGATCERSVRADGDWRCIVPFKRLGRPLGGARNEPLDWLWVSASAFYYVSTSHKGYGGGDVQGFGFDPMLVFSRFRGEDVRFTSGFGLSLQRFWSSDFDAVGNAGLKFQPVAVEFPVGGTAKAKLAYNLRYYWDGFESTPPVLAKASLGEATHGIVFSVTF
jgi:hypothetical protein